MGKISKAVAAGLGAAITTFVGMAGAGSNLQLGYEILSALGAGIIGFNATYWAPANK